MNGNDGERQPEGQRKLCTELKCEWCGEALTPKNRNGVPARFHKECSVKFHNNQKIKAVAMMNKRSARAQQRKSRRGQPVWNNQTTQRLCLDLIPAEDRPALLAQAAKNLNLTESPVLTVARQVGRICDMTIKQGQPSPFFSPEEIRVKAALATDPEEQLKLEAMLGVLEASLQEVAA